MVDASASRLSILASRLCVGFPCRRGLHDPHPDRAAGVEVALALINMTIVAVASWRLQPVGRWATVGLLPPAGAPQLVGGGMAIPEIPREALAWHVGLRLAALASVAARWAPGAPPSGASSGRRMPRAVAPHERDSARRDRLTRLWNSRYLHEALEGEIYRGRRYGRPFGLLVLDLDGFKAVNDTAGHEAGDRVLQAVGRVIRENCRASDIPARLGGDEFVVILPEASRLTVPRYALKLVDLVGALSFPPGQPRVTASVGAIAFERAPESVEAALAAADDDVPAKRGEEPRGRARGRRVVNFVLDIETIPRDLRAEPRKIQEYVWERVARRADPEGAGPGLDEFLAGMDGAVFAAMRRDVERYMALRPEFGHVICIGMGHDGRGRGDLETKALTARAVDDERRILEAFWEVVRSSREWRFVTYNGLAFDLPYLIRRSIYVGVPPSSGLPLRPYSPDSHFDVMRVLSNWERADAVRLDVVAALLGLQKWPPGMEGSQVLGLWREGRIDDIEAYCLGDVRLAYEVFLRVEAYFR